MMRIACVVLALAASVAAADKKPDDLVKDQVAALKARDMGKLVALFAKDATVIGLQKVGTIDEDILDGLRYPNPHAVLKGIKATTTKVGVRDGVAWLAFELVCNYTGAEPGFGTSKWTTTYWVTELAIKTGDAWKIVAAHVGIPQKGTGSELDEPPDAESPELAKLVLSNAEFLSTYLSKEPSATVLGTEPSERGFGNAAAKKLAGKWKKLDWSIAGKVREVSGQSGKLEWAYIVANIDLPVGKQTQHMRALLIGIIPVGATFELLSAHFSLAGDG